MERLHEWLVENALILSLIISVLSLAAQLIALAQ